MAAAALVCAGCLAPEEGETEEVADVDEIESELVIVEETDPEDPEGVLSDLGGPGDFGDQAFQAVDLSGPGGDRSSDPSPLPWHNPQDDASTND